MFTIVSLPDSCPTDISVGLVPVTIELSPGSACWQLLSPSEKDRVTRFRNSSDVARFANIRIALRLLLSQKLSIHPEDVAIESDSDGWPTLGYPLASYRSYPNVDFNVSHSGDYGMVAISSLHRVGIDIQQYDPVLEWWKLAPTTLSFSECAHIHKLPKEQQLATFYVCWTAKESLLKCAGIGLRYDLSQISLPLHMQRIFTWSMKSMSRLVEYVASPIHVPSGYSAHLAWEQHR